MTVPRFNGVPVDREALQALGLLNYGHFTTMCFEDRRVRGLALHLERLVRDCQLLFGKELDRAKLHDLIGDAVADEDAASVARVTIFDPVLQLNHPAGDSEPGVLVTCRRAGGQAAPPMHVRSTVYHRDLPLVKHTGLFGPLWHRRAAQLAGFDDALFVNAESSVSEGPTWNIGFFDGENVVWPDAEVLPGVTENLITQVARRVRRAPVRLSELPEMEAAFAVNAGWGIRAVRAIDDFSFPQNHPVIKTLRQQYESIPPERV